MSSERLACVTGATGFLGSHVVKILLERNYRVRGTVRQSTPLSPPPLSLKKDEEKKGEEEKRKGDHLWELEGARERLELVHGDLMEFEGMKKAMEGVDVCFHVASPFFNTPKSDPQKELIEPATQGTKNVLEACFENGVQDVILTSSTASVLMKDVEEGHEWTEDDWSDTDKMRDQKFWYPLSKTLAEKWAWDYVEEKKEKIFRLVVMNPTLISGPPLQDSLNTSTEVIMEYCTGKHKSIPTGKMTWVDVRDVAMAHILAAEDGSASGRYLLIAEQYPWSQGLAIFQESSLPSKYKSLLPTTSLPPAEEAPSRYNQKKEILFSQRKAISLGLSFRSMDDSLRDLVSSPVFLSLLEKN